MRHEDDSLTPPDILEAEVIAFLENRSVPCPRCAHELRGLLTAKCPECGEPLILKIGSPRVRFGWLLLAMAPGCFSGIAAVFVSVPIVLATAQGYPPGRGAPWPIVAADAFGFLSAAAVVLMYRHRHRIMSWTEHRQRAFAAAVWGVHVLTLAIVVLSLGYWY